MDEGFMQRLLRLRVAFGKPMAISSGYRDKTHPVEASKTTTGAHTTGKACDVAIEGADALRLIHLAYIYGFTGIGVNQKGRGRFIHLDTLEAGPGQPRPHLWTYP